MAPDAQTLPLQGAESAKCFRADDNQMSPTEDRFNIAKG